MRSKLMCVLAMTKMSRALLVAMVLLCSTLGLAQANGNGGGTTDVRSLSSTGGTMTGPIVGKTTYLFSGSRFTDGLSLTDVNGNAIGTGTLKGHLQIAYLSVASGGLVSVDNSPPSGSASISDYAGNSFGITAGKFFFGSVSGVPLPIYRNNAAAIAGGLEHGNLYRTGNDPDVVCVVH